MSPAWHRTELELQGRRKEMAPPPAAAFRAPFAHEFDRAACKIQQNSRDALRIDVLQHLSGQEVNRLLVVFLVSPLASGALKGLSVLHHLPHKSKVAVPDCAWEIQIISLSGRRPTAHSGPAVDQPEKVTPVMREPLATHRRAPFSIPFISFLSEWQKKKVKACDGNTCNPLGDSMHSPKLAVSTSGLRRPARCAGESKLQRAGQTRLW